MPCGRSRAAVSFPHPEKIAVCDTFVLSELIRPSGFYNTKSERLQNLCEAMIEDFGDFDTFTDSVSREWLLAQKGIGKESADSILCYACERDIMVVDSYTFRLFKAELNIEDMEYDEIREMIESEMEANHAKAASLLGSSEVTLCKIYAIFHGLIVEFCKTAFKGKTQKERLLERT